jgi:ABC-type dipeptide/oligopeptide/nickel transport system permease subunit
MLRHLLPNAISPILVHVSLLAPVVLLGEATLAYLGLGLDPRVPDWGQMISSGQRYYATAWWVVLFPSMAVAVCTLALTLVADAVHDTLSPGSRAHPGR